MSSMAVRSRVSRRTFVRTAASALPLFAVGCSTTPDAPTETRLRVITFPANHQRIAGPLQRALERTLPGVRLEVYRLTRDNLRLLNQGEADIAFGWADRAYMAYLGGNEVEAAPLDHLRGVAVLQPVPIYLMVRPELHVDNVGHLRGRRVNMGPAMGSMHQLGRRIFDAYGVRDAIREEHLETAAAAQELATGQLDAMFASITTPTSLEPALRVGATLLPLDGEEIASVRRQFPFVRRVPIAFTPVVRAGHTSTLGLDSMIVCRHDLDDHLVYGFTKAFFMALPELAASEPAMNAVEAAEAAATALPLHPGALQYYREQELSR